MQRHFKTSDKQVAKVNSSSPVVQSYPIILIYSVEHRGMDKWGRLGREWIYFVGIKDTLVRCVWVVDAKKDIIWGWNGEKSKVPEMQMFLSVLMKQLGNSGAGDLSVIRGKGGKAIWRPGMEDLECCAWTAQRNAVTSHSTANLTTLS